MSLGASTVGFACGMIDKHITPARMEALKNGVFGLVEIIKLNAEKLKGHMNRLNTKIKSVQKKISGITNATRSNVNKYVTEPLKKMREERTHLRELLKREQHKLDNERERYGRMLISITTIEAAIERALSDLDEGNAMELTYESIRRKLGQQFNWRPIIEAAYDVYDSEQQIDRVPINDALVVKAVFDLAWHNQIKFYEDATNIVVDPVSGTERMGNPMVNDVTIYIDSHFSCEPTQADFARSAANPKQYAQRSFGITSYSDNNKLIGMPVYYDDVENGKPKKKHGNIIKVDGQFNGIGTAGEFISRNVLIQTDDGKIEPHPEMSLFVDMERFGKSQKKQKKQKKSIWDRPNSSSPGEILSELPPSSVQSMTAMQPNNYPSLPQPPPPPDGYVEAYPSHSSAMSIQPSLNLHSVMMDRLNSGPAQPAMLPRSDSVQSVAQEMEPQQFSLFSRSPSGRSPTGFTRKRGRSPSKSPRGGTRRRKNTRRR